MQLEKNSSSLQKDLLSVADMGLSRARKTWSPKIFCAPHSALRFCDFFRRMAEDDVDDLMRQRDLVDAKLKEMQAVLTSQGVGMTGSLVDADGFPRADIDVYLVRMSRASVVSLRNDYNNLNEKILSSLQKLHTNRATLRNASVQSPSSFPFLLVGKVSSGSPCEGVLMEGDRITMFGMVQRTSSGMSSSVLLQQVARLVQDEMNVSSIELNYFQNSICIRLIRSGAISEVYLTPREWEGHGSVGCSFIPL